MNKQIEDCDESPLYRDCDQCGISEGLLEQGLINYSDDEGDFELCKECAEDRKYKSFYGHSNDPRDDGPSGY